VSGSVLSLNRPRVRVLATKSKPVAASPAQLLEHRARHHRDLPGRCPALETQRRAASLPRTSSTTADCCGWVPPSRGLAQHAATLQATVADLAHAPLPPHHPGRPARDDLDIAETSG
jgi:hypothetical protein